MKRYVALVMVVLLVLGLVPGGAMAGPFTDALDELKASGKQSNSYLTHSFIDMTNVSAGSVVAYTYAGDNEGLTVNNLSVQAQSNFVAADKLTRYVFNLTNQYRPETEISIGFSLPDLETVNVYTYGNSKDQAMLVIVSGITDCLINLRLGDGSNSGDTTWSDKYKPVNITQNVFTSFKIGQSTYTAPNGSTQIMDVAPEIVGKRTFIPIRYLASSLGATIAWNNTTQTATITNSGTTISLNVGSATQTVNGKPVTMDVAPYIKNGRTMLPARWVAEPLGATVEWDEATQQSTIKFTQVVEQTQ